MAGCLVALWERQYYVWDQCTQWAQFFIQLYVGRFSPHLLPPQLGWPALSGVWRAEGSYVEPLKAYNYTATSAKAGGC